MSSITGESCITEDTVSATGRPALVHRKVKEQKQKKQLREAREKMSSSDEERKPAVDPTSHINLKVVAQKANEALFRIKRNTPLKKLMNAYCERQAVEFGTFVFLFDGDKIKPQSTPLEMGMEDGDKIDAMEHQDGGGAASTW